MRLNLDKFLSMCWKISMQLFVDRIHFLSPIFLRCWLYAIFTYYNIYIIYTSQQNLYFISQWTVKYNKYDWNKCVTCIYLSNYNHIVIVAKYFVYSFQIP